MILTLHRRFPQEDHWEIDPEPFGSIVIKSGEIFLEMDENPVKNQIRRVIGKPITYIGAHEEDLNRGFLKTVEQGSMEYVDALSAELRRFGIEACRGFGKG